MMSQEVEKALDRKLQEMPAQVSTVSVLVCHHNHGDNTVTIVVGSVVIVSVGER